MHKRSIRALSFLIGLGLVALGFAIEGGARVHAQARQAECDRLCALTDAVTHLEGIADGLTLAVAAEQPLPTLIALRHDADLAAAALGRLSFSGSGGEALRRFAAAVAEYSGILADVLARDGGVPDYAMLIHLRDFARPLADRILPAAVDLTRGTVDESALAVHFASFGRLYYDGVASDVMHPGGYLSLMRGTPIDERRARAIAGEAIGGSIRLERVETGGEPDRFCFSGANLTIAVSVNDGKLLTLLYDRRAEKGSADEATLRAAAEAAIAAHAPESMVLVDVTAGACSRYYIFAPEREGILYLSERILVALDEATAKLTLWDADRYYRYHTDARTMPSAMLSAEAAALYYGSATLPILCTALRADGRELLCYRFGEGRAAVYLNAVTGRVEEIA